MTFVWDVLTSVSVWSGGRILYRGCNHGTRDVRRRMLDDLDACRSIRAWLTDHDRSVCAQPASHC
jgi:hypothetical protein